MSLKTIKVNPIFLASAGSGGGSSGFAAKNKTRKEKPSGVSLGQSNSIKKKLIARIKNFQHNKQTTQTQETTEVDNQLNDAFGESVQFLDNLARDKEEQKREKKNTSLKKKQTYNTHLNIATELPPELDWNAIAPPQTPMPIAQMSMPTAQMPAPIVQVPAPIAQMPTPTVQAPAPTVQWNSPPQPSYSNLKTGGTRPTYRTWLRTTQKHKPSPAVKPSINILEDIAAPLESEATPSELEHVIDISTDPAMPGAQTMSGSMSGSMPGAEAMPVAITDSLSPTAPSYMPSFKQKRKRITKTLKYKLGKHANGKVSVLIKNSQTRRKVQTEQALLKQKSILEIKNHLRSNNLLKAGSNAPSDVLRQLYEQSILAGQIENKSKDTLIHNYFNDEKK